MAHENNNSQIESEPTNEIDGSYAHRSALPFHCVHMQTRALSQTATATASTISVNFEEAQKIHRNLPASFPTPPHRNTFSVRLLETDTVIYCRLSDTFTITSFSGSCQISERIRINGAHLPGTNTSSAQPRKTHK